jgi:hypothetical protein
MKEIMLVRMRPMSRNLAAEKIKDVHINEDIV